MAQSLREGVPLAAPLREVHFGMAQAQALQLGQGCLDLRKRLGFWRADFKTNSSRARNTCTSGGRRSTPVRRTQALPAKLPLCTGDHMALLGLGVIVGILLLILGRRRASVWAFAVGALSFLLYHFAH